MECGVRGGKWPYSGERPSPLSASMRSTLRSISALRTEEKIHIRPTVILGHGLQMKESPHTGPAATSGGSDL
eukprot:9478345-Pyramimonas_sp.AAC.3